MKEALNRLVRESTINNIDKICDGAIWCTLSGVEADIIGMSQKACELFKVDSFEEIIGKGSTRFCDYFTLADNTQRWELKKFLEGEISSIIIKMYAKDSEGTPIYFDLACNMLDNPVSKDGKLAVAKIYFTPVYKSLEDEKDILNNIDNSIVIIKNVPNSFPIVFANRAFCNTVGNNVNPHDGGDIEEFVHYVSPTDREVFETSVHNALIGKNEKVSYRVVDENGEAAWHLTSSNMILFGSSEHIVINLTSVHELMSAQSALKEEGDKWNDIVNNIPAGLIIFTMDEDATEVIAVNDRLAGFANEVGRRVDGNHRNWDKNDLAYIFSKDVYAFTLEADKPKVKNMLDFAKRDGFSDCIFRLRGSDANNTVWIRSLSSCTVKEGKEVYYVTFSNATREVKNTIDLQKSHDALRKLSLFDPLTKVHSRNAYNDVCERAKLIAFKNTGFIFADVNGLKATNDTYGHNYGDNMICAFADILRQDFDNDYIYRISGDEFVVVCENISRELFIKKVDHVRELTEKENNIASIGYIWEDNTPNLTVTVSAAEQLMYVEKQQYYTLQSEKTSKHHKKMVDNFTKELAGGQFEMYLQPKSNINNQIVAGAEALVRKFDLNGKLVLPNDFIPLLEHEKLIPSLDYFMLEEVCKTITRWEHEGRRPIKISVNMSRVTMAENHFLDRILEICDSYDVNRGLIELEITESTASMDHRRLIEEVLALRNAGFSVSLDDMGTDYSALQMLLVEGIQTVKLDRAFILQMETVRGKTLLEHLIQMSHALGYDCIAEGVENHEQRKQLSDMGCDMYQGYLLSKPIPVKDFEDLMDEY